MRNMARGKRAEAPSKVDYTPYADKEPTDLQRRFGEWILDKTGIEFGTNKEEAAFKEGVRLGTALRMQFQGSPENQEVLEARKAAVEERKTAPKPKRGRGRPKAEVEPEEVDEEPEEDEEEDDEPEDAAPAPKPRKAAARSRKAPASKPAARTTRRKAAAAKSDDAPF